MRRIILDSENTLPVIGLSSERKRFVEALQNRESLLLLGPRGCGKTTVILSVIQALSHRSDIVYLPYLPTFHELLVSLARALLDAECGYLRRIVPKKADADKWLSQQTSVHLRGILWSTLETEPMPIILDGVDGASHPIFRFFQRLYFAPGMALFAAACNSVALGALTRLFWHPQKVIHFKPLSEVHAIQLFDRAVEHFGLGHLGVEDFRQKVLAAANGNPGQIVQMCRLATDPQYVTGKYIKFVPLRMDALTKFLA